MKKIEEVSEEIEVARNKILVGWDIKFIEDGDGETIKPQVMVSFAYERASTQMGEKQGEHASAHALGVMLVMQLLKNFIPLEIANYSGITRLTDEMQLVKLRDEFFLEHFRINYSKSQLLESLPGEIGAQRELANDTLDALRGAANVAKMYTGLPAGSLKATTKDAESVLTSLAGINVELLKGQNLAVRRDYCMRVSILSATRLLEYLNKAPFVTFERIKKVGDDAIYEKGEGARVRKALAYLQDYATSSIDIVMDIQVAEADAENLRRAPPRVAKVVAENVAAAKQLVAEQESIVDAMCDLLHYPEVSKEYIAKAKSSENIRTNNPQILCFVIARHLATIFATFNDLDNREDKMELVEAFINRKLNSWRLSADTKEQIAVGVSGALLKWEVEKHKTLKDMEERRTLAFDQSGISLDTSMESTNLLGGSSLASSSTGKGILGMFSAQKETPQPGFVKQTEVAAASKATKEQAKQSSIATSDNSKNDKAGFKKKGFFS